MPIIGNPLTIGGKGNGFVAWLYGTGSGTTYTTRGSWTVYDDSAASVSGNVLTLTRAGTYTVYFGMRGGYNNSGTAIALYARIYHNTTTVFSSTTIDNTGVSSSVSITAAAGDTIYIQTRNSSGSNTHNFTLLVEMQ